MGVLGFELKNQANLEIITQDVLKSTEIEGEVLDADQVRSSVARRLGLDISGLVYSDRGVTDMLLARSDNQSYRFYSMSAQIRKERKLYYDILERTQRGKIDITDWLGWFLRCLLNVLEVSGTILNKILQKHSFWFINADKVKNERQKKLLNRLLDGFKGKLTTSKWAKIAKCFFTLN